MKPVLLLLASAAALFPQAAGEANAHYQTEKDRQAVARGLSQPGRDATQKPAELVARMGLKPGMAVADIGSGTGYMLPYLSRAVGASGQVIAEDIFPDFLDKAKARAGDEKLGNVSFIKGTEKDPLLPEGSVDVALALDSYHHYDYPLEMLAGIRKGLRADGRLVLVEYYKRPGAMSNTDAVKHIRLDKQDVIREIEAAGFSLLSDFEQIQGSQYGLILRKR